MEKKKGFSHILYMIFVHNWGLKLTAILTAGVLWLLAVGL